ncbi:conjugative transfer signal peptidase TraF [Pseudomonas sp. CFBP 13602]|uniref:conjugative transfer signal peptidase TraF n=1 Tax=Pseudomonas sp. CFBP 13602 TaxID=2774039 RepID=UPI00177FF21D|nr:conjugative transfer signal peptidase TraF [Pseudomonas sp. CFBP 13602]MBD8829006.1 conjugative transfer signal peptidase TraF [Pseudomonas sp. CFBP 13602]
MNARKGFQVVAGVTLAVSIGTAIVAGGIYAAGGRFNTSKSLALGLYWITDAPVNKGAYVMVCPPERQVFLDARERGYIDAGFCPGNFGHLMKKILAAKGDTISVTSQGVTVNGEVLPYSKPIAADGVGRPLPQLSSERYTLGESELLLMSDSSPTSFDGRYFGPITRGQVTSVIRPVLTWKGE